MNNSRRPSAINKKKPPITSKIILIFICVTIFAVMTVISIKTIFDILEKSPQREEIPSSDHGLKSEITEKLPPTQELFDNNEVRGIYIATVTNINFPSVPELSAAELKAELDDIISTCKEANLNSIYFQVRPSADSLYNSKIFPTSAYLTGTQGAPLTDGFDPLQYIIEEAHKVNIRVHAWINPFRVTVGSKSNPKHDVSELSENHPARINPSYVVPYEDGRLYFDCGIPEVRTLIADGVYEIAANYDVDSVIFDDYFYPYPTYNQNKKPALFDDSASYKKYGGGLSLDDWRRENVNKTIEACYNAIKGADKDCEFGIAPFGIWQNDNGTNGGSDTSGLESYSAIYCDPLAWIRGGYIDYIAPQIYWDFNDKNARYDVLVRWWNQQLDGSDVKLLISHSAYRYDEWENPENEMRCQIEFARSELAYKGSILYGYAALKNNSHGLLDEVADVFSENIRYEDVSSNGRDLIISIPYSGSYIDGEGTFVIGTSDPAEPLFIDGERVGRTKSGYFSLFLPISEGENEFTFSHKGKEINYIINGGKVPENISSEIVYPTLKTPEIAAVTPIGEWAGKESLEVSVTAPRGAKVTATLDGKTISLMPTLYVPYNSGYMKEVYTGSFSLVAKDNEILNLGKVEFTSVFEGNTYKELSGEIRAMGKNASIPVEVLKDDTEMKIAHDSWYYDDYIPQSAGMRDNAVSLSGGMYKLRSGGYIAADAVKELDLKPISIPQMKKAFLTSDSKAVYFKIKVSENLPINCYIENGEFCVTLYNTQSDNPPKVAFEKNSLFSSVRGEKSVKANAYKYFFKLYDIENFYGFEHYYENRHIVIKFRSPQTLPDSNTPLSGKTIVLDAGHGGKNPGALGPLGSSEDAINESDFNLKIVLEAEKHLKMLGASVVLTRDEESETDVPIADRLDMLIDIAPDLVISIHQNSMPYTSDVTRIHGCVGLYWSDSGYMLTDVLGNSISTALNKIDRSPTKQKLAMVRNQKFPATLIETCFMTNVEEYERMMKPNTVEVISKAITDGVINYYKAQEKYILK